MRNERELKQVNEMVFTDSFAESNKSIFDEDVDIINEDLAYSEAQYREAQVSEQVAPIVKEKVEEAIETTVKRENDKLKLEVSEVLDAEVTKRLDKFDRRRRNRKMLQMFKGFCKLAIVVFVILVIWGNQNWRSKIQAVAAEIYDAVQTHLVDTWAIEEDVEDAEVETGVKEIMYDYLPGAEGATYSEKILNNSIELCMQEIFECE